MEAAVANLFWHAGDDSLLVDFCLGDECVDDTTKFELPLASHLANGFLNLIWIDIVGLGINVSKDWSCSEQ